MKRLGKGTGHSEREGLVVDSEFAPKKGAKVVDKKMNVIGRVSDVIGSVDRPFVLVTNGKEAKDAVGETLYVL